MSRLSTTGGDDTEKPIDVKVPILAIEDDVIPPTMEDHEIAVTETEKDDQPKTTEPISLEEILNAQREDLECKHYVSNIGLPSCRFP